MDNEFSVEEFITKYKTEFKKLIPVNSAVGEKIHFNMLGFKHLVFKGKHRRPTKVIVNRLLLNTAHHSND